MRSAAPDESGKLAASLAHEINNPIDTVLNLLHQLRSEPDLSQKSKDCLSSVEQEVYRISQIASDALKASRMKAPAKPTNVPQLLRSVLDFNKSRFQQRGIMVNSEYCGDGDLSVHPGPLRQVFWNLLLNAADSMPNGGELHVRVAAGREWNGLHRRGLRVTFADTGCGIETENLHHIFEPFFSTKGPHGNGLGLSLVKDMVQREGGSVRVRSCTKQRRSGSVFSIFLPAA